MRSLAASILMFLLLAVVVLVVALVASLGVAAMGWVVSRVFDLTQWQGTLVALGVTLGTGFLLYQLGGPPAPVVAPVDYDEWDDDDPEETPLVPWRQRRPTPGQLPAEKRSKTAHPPRK
jgi:hypothetical protein